VCGVRVDVEVLRGGVALVAVAVESVVAEGG
jgi:hypothetical protein